MRYGAERLRAVRPSKWCGWAIFSSIWQWNDTHLLRHQSGGAAVSYRWTYCTEKWGVTKALREELCRTPATGEQCAVFPPSRSYRTWIFEQLFALPSSKEQILQITAKPSVVINWHGSVLKKKTKTN